MDMGDNPRHFLIHLEVKLTGDDEAAESLNRFTVEEWFCNAIHRNLISTSDEGIVFIKVVEVEPPKSSKGEG